MTGLTRFSAPQQDHVDETFVVGLEGIPGPALAQAMQGPVENLGVFLRCFPVISPFYPELSLGFAPFGTDF